MTTKKLFDFLDKASSDSEKRDIAKKWIRENINDQDKSISLQIILDDLYEAKMFAYAEINSYNKFI